MAEDHTTKHNTGAKITAAFAFSAVGGKLGLLGLVADANALYEKGTPLAQKFKGLFNGEIKNRINIKKFEAMATGKSEVAALFGLTKYYMISSTILVAATGIAGWMRADRVASSSDMFWHPIDSTLIILGFREPHTSKAANTQKAALATEIEYQPEIPTNHTQKELTRRQETAAVAERG